MTSYDALVDAAKTSLLAARQDISAEIRDYPTPISGCDAQFNHLIGQQQKICEALAALDAHVFVPTPRTPSPDAGIESR